MIDHTLLLIAIDDFHFKLFWIRALVPMLILNHTMYCLHCKTSLRGKLLNLVDRAVVDGDADVEIAEDGELLALFDQHFGPLALGVTFLHQIQYWFNVPVSRCHFKIKINNFLILEVFYNNLRNLIY